MTKMLKIVVKDKGEIKIEISENTAKQLPEGPFAAWAIVVEEKPNMLDELLSRITG